ncbi:MAG: hypothetical protein KDC98_22330 [Planctomycetes bacterium]|nr:hypothetical protein [Planctomycetota bacterium]
MREAEHQSRTVGAEGLEAMRQNHSVVSIVFVATMACGTVSERQDARYPAPVGEVAMTVGGIAGAFPGEAEVRVGNRVVRRTATLEHAWVAANGGRAQITFRLAYSTPIDLEQMALDEVEAHWNLAGQRSRRICAASDLATEAGVAACEQALCRELTEVLFPNGDWTPIARVERVLWQRVRLD